ncbi:polyadenylate-binding protein 1-like [Silurus meridionalis]|uniref:polyadenylate-binding protein 1-like n=1 Tax=Silurus meridionalis TaxID=175797 RepID=UPI001EEC3ABD|nr:polyadenylate-binding protein 1-like [Silurus meridionalis]
MTDLYEAFLRFGTVLTAQVMMENGRSKVIGYVTFSSADEAGVAILEMNGRVLGSRTVYLSPSQTTQGQSHGMKVETISPSKPCPDPRPNANKNIHPQSGTAQWTVQRLWICPIFLSE